MAAEVAAACGYQQIDFLDDCPADGVIGTIEETETKAPRYDAVFVAIGNNKVRTEKQGRLEKKGASVAVLIQPTACISSTATIGIGSAIEPKAL